MEIAVNNNPTVDTLLSDPFEELSYAIVFKKLESTVVVVQLYGF